MELASSQQGNTVVIALKGRMDALSAPQFEKECAVWLDKGVARVVADLSGLEYISSAGLRSILAMAKKLKSADGHIRVCRLSGVVQEVFTMAGFATMFTLYASVEDALAG